ncbi:MAG TPA: serine/threonine-protein kinase [Thermoanaerobaculia bacterium]|nr:serine/threonine-protein kinase [Thermoanaerobaculia bacterium]
MSADPRLPDLFAHASELVGAARADWLAVLHAEDPALAADVAELLAASTAGERRFATPAWERLSPGRDEESDGGEAPMPARIGPYRVVREIGRGGMGRVFLAEQEEAEFRRTVALKVLDRPAAAAEALRRFRDEARILAALEHPGIARLYDAGRAEDGTWFLALEYVEGDDLLSFVRRHGLDLRARVELFLQVLDAVDFAHRRLVVHRDVKPGNVVVGVDGRPKLLDFGISKVLDPEAGDDAATRTELRALTPAYASPEQLRGERAAIASDVYSLGVVLYELLAGRRPFARGDGSRSARDWAGERDPEPPSAAVGRAQSASPATAPETTAAAPISRRDLAGDLDAIVAKALRAEPESRYRSAAAFADDLRRWLDGRPVEARRGGRRYRLAKFVRRNRAPVASAALALVALVGGTVIALLQARASARERDRAVESLRRAEITNDLSGLLLAEADPAGGPVSRANLLARGEKVIDQRFAGDLPLRVHMLLTLAERYYENVQYDEWKRTVERAYALSRPLHDKRLRALAACTMANVEADTGERSRVEPLIVEALDDLAGEPEAMAEEARCRVNESNAAYQKGDAATAIRAGERALALERARRGPPGRELEALNTLANAYTLGDRFADADRTYAALMALFAAQGRDRTHGAAICLNNWAVEAQNAGQIRRAVELSERAVALAREVDAERGAPANDLWSLGSVLSLVGRRDESLALVDEAVEKTRHGGAPWQRFWSLATAARVALEAQRRDLAEARLRELQQVELEQANPPLSQQAGLERTLARAALANGDGARAVTLAKSALHRLETADRPPREVLPVLLVLASSLNESGDHAAARTAAERALQLASARLGGYPYSLELGVADLELGVAQAATGDADAGERSLRTAVEALRTSVGENGPETRRATASLARLGAGCCPQARASLH